MLSTILGALLPIVVTKQANLQRANVRKIQSLKGAEIPAEEAYMNRPGIPGGSIS